MAHATALYAGDGRLLFSVSESAQGGAGLNGDGDASDSAFHLIELP